MERIFDLSFEKVVELYEKDELDIYYQRERMVAGASMFPEPVLENVTSRDVSRSPVKVISSTKRL